MAFNILSGLGAGLSQSAGNRSALMLADRLKKEAEARALAQRQTLDSEEFGRRESLQNALIAAQDARQVGADEQAMKRTAMTNRQTGRTAGATLGTFDPSMNLAEQLLANSQERARRQALKEVQDKLESDALVGQRNRSNREKPATEGKPTVEFRNAGDSLLAMTKNPDGSWASEVVDVPGGGKPKDNAQAFKDYQRAIGDEVDLLYKDYKLRLDNGLIEPKDFPTNAEIVKAATETVKKRMDLVAGGRTAILSPGLSPGGTGGISVQEAQAMWENTGN